MATKRRPWIARVCVVAAVSLGALVGVTSPAVAAGAQLESSNFDPGTITVGNNSTLKLKIKNTNAVPTQFTIKISTTSSAATISGASQKATSNLAPNATGDLQFTVRGQAQGNANFVIQDVSGGASTELGQESLTINSGQQEQQYVGLIRGDVKNNADGKAVPNAVVTVQDPSGKTAETRTNTTGQFQFDGKSLKLAPGVLIFQVTRDPFVLVGGPKSVTFGANENKSVSLGMENPTLATTAPPVASTDAPAPSADTSLSPGAAVDTKAAADSGGLDTMTWIMIIVGGLLVALGIGAIVLLLVRRNNDDEEDDEEDDVPARGRPGGPRGPVPAGQRPPAGAYGGPGQGPGMYGRPSDPTMVARPGMGDAPTQMHRPGMVDQYGNPTQVYGQQPQQPGWGPPQPGYGAPSSPGGAYGAPSSPGGAYGGQASGGGGYGGQASGGGGYGGQASGGGGYGGQASGGGAYGAPPQQQPGWGGYDQQGGYGQQQQGYGAPGQYEEPTQYAGPNAGPTSGGYGGQQGGYDPQGGYGQQQGYGSGGGGYTPDPYGQPDPYGGQQGYGQQQGYPDDRRNRGDRRLDWLDD